jgi:hypothetical protein
MEKKLRNDRHLKISYLWEIEDFMAMKFNWGLLGGDTM